MRTYFLAPHAYMCLTEHHAVFLDLKRDEYCALDRAEIAALHAIVLGWPERREPAQDEPRAACDPAIVGVVTKLLEEGLLTDCERTGKSAIPVAIVPPAAVLHPLRPEQGWKLSHALRLMIAWLAATYMLRFWPIERIVERVRKRKTAATNGNWKMDFEKAGVLIKLYRWMQPKLFSPIDACLRNSLTLIEFLAQYRLYPTWVFGVRMLPFSAHSWVQEDHVVFNDPVPHVNSYTPILTI